MSIADKSAWDESAAGRGKTSKKQAKNGVSVPLQALKCSSERNSRYDRHGVLNPRG
jgi:hypothetical protein